MYEHIIGWLSYAGFICTNHGLGETKPLSELSLGQSPSY